MKYTLIIKEYKCLTSAISLQFKGRLLNIKMFEKNKYIGERPGFSNYYLTSLQVHSYINALPLN